MSTCVGSRPLRRPGIHTAASAPWAEFPVSVRPPPRTRTCHRSRSALPAGPGPPATRAEPRGVLPRAEGRPASRSLCGLGQPRGKGLVTGGACSERKWMNAGS